MSQGEPGVQLWKTFETQIRKPLSQASDVSDWKEGIENIFDIFGVADYVVHGDISQKPSGKLENDLRVCIFAYIDKSVAKSVDYPRLLPECWQDLVKTLDNLVASSITKIMSRLLTLKSFPNESAEYFRSRFTSLVSLSGVINMTSDEILFYIYIEALKPNHPEISEQLAMDTYMERSLTSAIFRHRQLEIELNLSSYVPPEHGYTPDAPQIEYHQHQHQRTETPNSQHRGYKDQQDNVEKFIISDDEINIRNTGELEQPQNGNKLSIKGVSELTSTTSSVLNSGQTTERVGSQQERISASQINSLSRPSPPTTGSNMSTSRDSANDFAKRLSSSYNQNGTNVHIENRNWDTTVPSKANTSSQKLSTGHSQTVRQTSKSPTDMVNLSADVSSEPFPTSAAYNTSQKIPSRSPPANPNVINVAENVTKEQFDQKNLPENRKNSPIPLAIDSAKSNSKLPSNVNSPHSPAVTPPSINNNINQNLAKNTMAGPENGEQPQQNKKLKPGNNNISDDSNKKSGSAVPSKRSFEGGYSELSSRIKPSDKRTYNNQSTNFVKCIYCGKTNHKSEDCFYRPGNEPPRQRYRDSYVPPSRKFKRTAND